MNCNEEACEAQNESEKRKSGEKRMCCNKSKTIKGKADSMDQRDKTTLYSTINPDLSTAFIS